MKKSLGRTSILEQILDLRWFYSFLGLVVIFALSSLLSKSFLTAGNIMTILRQASILLMLSLGLTAVVLTGNIDLSVNSCAALTGCICAKLLVGHMPVAAAILISMMVGVASGLFNGFLVGVLRLPSFIATYGTNMVLSGLATIVMNGGVIYDLPKGFTQLGVGYLGPIPIPIIIVAVTAVLLVILLQKTTLGRKIYMYGHNLTASKFSGTNNLRVLMISFVLCGLTGAFGGILMCARLNAADAGMADTYGLQIVASVVVGGTSLLGGEGSIFGTIIGAIVLTSITNIMNLLMIDSAWQNFVVGVVILLMVWIDVFTRSKRTKKAG